MEETAAAGDGGRPEPGWDAPPGRRLGDEERAERLAPADRPHRPHATLGPGRLGGDLVLVGVDVEAGVVEVQLQGACSSCAVSSSTLQGGVERILTQPPALGARGGRGLDEDMDPYESASLGQGGYVPKY